MTIIDSHAHIYPDAIAQKAAQSIAEFYGIPVCMDGTLGAMLQAGEEAGIGLSLVHSVAITWRRAHNINEYLGRTVAQHPGRLVGFGSLHPEDPNPLKELEHIKALGLKGVKLHPDFQYFYLDDTKAMALCGHMAAMGLALLTHVGDQRYAYSHPERLARVMDALPSLKVIAAHLGGWSMWEEGWPKLAGRPNLWVDTCSSLYALEPRKAAEIIRSYGADRVFFATDYPMWNPAEELERFNALPLTPQEREGILHANFEAFWAEL